MKSTGKDAVKTVKMTAENLEYYRKLINKATALTAILNEVLLWVNTIKQHCMLEKSFMKGSQSTWQMSLSSYFKKLPEQSQLSATITLINQQLSTSRQTLH